MPPATTAADAFRADVLLVLKMARGLMKRYGRETLKEWEDIDGKHMTLGGRDVMSADDSTSDLPVSMQGRKSQKAQRRVYRILKALRAELGELTEILPSTLFRAWSRFYPNSEASIGTIKGALTYLRKKRIAYPAKDGRGWVFGMEQGVLFPGNDATPSAQPATIGYAAPVAHDSRAHARGVAMNEKKFLWVPMEEGMLRDCKTDEIFPPGDLVEDMHYEDKRGRARIVKATRGELVELVEARSGQLARVRVGKHTLLTPILGDWHERGELAPPATGPKSPWPACSGS